MKQCPFCKEQIHDEATRCRFCSSRLDPAEPASSAQVEQVVYVVDKGLVRFAKFALGILAIFAVVGAFLYGIKIEQAADSVIAAKKEASEARDAMAITKKEAQDLLDAIVAPGEQIRADADTARSFLEQIRRAEKEATSKLAQIESPGVTDQQIRSAVDYVLLGRFKEVLTPEQLANLMSPAETKPTLLSELLHQPALRRIKIDDAIGLVTNGVPIRVAVIADPVAIDLPQLKDRIVVEATNATQDPTTDHGTAVVSLIAAIAPKAQILPLPWVTRDGGGRSDGLALAIRRAADAGARVVCIPLSGPRSDSNEDAVKYASERGVLLIAPVGNIMSAGVTPKKYPAAFAQVLCVASTNMKDKPARFSGSGDWVEIFAPGEQIRVLTTDGESMVMTGGSFSAALVSGVAALVLSERPELSPEQVTRILKDNAVSIVASLDAGRVDAAATVRAAKSFKR